MFRNYSTGSTKAPEANIINKLKNLHKRSETHEDLPIDRDVYKLLCNVEMLSLAYEKLKSKPGQMTPGINPETLDGMSKEVLEDIVVKLKSEKFKFQPGRKFKIPKKSGGTRTLIIAPPRDKIVQESMRLILEAIFEPTFLDSSHGFRPQRGCHTALKAIKQQFQSAS
jgi:retron-type reverse transcriptase